MSERAAVFQGTQLGVESTHGTAVAASKKLLCTTMKFMPKVQLKEFRPGGFKANTTLVKGKEHSEGSIDGVLSYNDIVYLLSGLLTAATITTPTGATNTRLWHFKPSATSEDSPKSFTVETGTDVSNFAERCTYAMVNDLVIRWTPEEAAVTGSIFAQETTEGITITGSPSLIAENPVDPEDITVFLGTGLNSATYTIALGSPTVGTFSVTITDPVTGTSETSGAIAFGATSGTVQTALRAMAILQSDDVSVTGTNPTFTVTFGGRFQYLAITMIAGATAGGWDGTLVVTAGTAGSLTRLTRCYEGEIAIGGRYGMQMTLDANFTSYSAHVEKAGTFKANLVIQHDSVSRALMTQLRAKTTGYCKIVSRGATIELDFPYEFQCVFPFKQMDDGRDEKHDVWASTKDLSIMYDSAFAGWVMFDIYNSLTAL